MRVRLWLWSGWWLTAVALVTAMAGLCTAASAGSSLLVGTEREGYRLAAVPEPPPPPRPTAQPGALPVPDSPAAEAIESDPDGGLGTETLAVPPMPPGVDLREPQSDGTVRVPPGLPVPTYPVVVNAPVEALI